nr:MAG TPA: 60S acidic ribosomal protein P0 [Caudoviricetes sp.]
MCNEYGVVVGDNRHYCGSCYLVARLETHAAEIQHRDCKAARRGCRRPRGCQPQGTGERACRK